MTPPWRVRAFDTLASTQDACRRHAEAGEPDRLAIRADRQTQGRGSQGRSWQSPAGNLSLSLLLRPGSPATEVGQWSLLAGVALVDCLGGLLPPGPRLRLKWPNDLLLDGRKLAGILVDSSARPDGSIDWVVIGIGVNLASAPEVPGRTTACIAEIAPAPDPAACAERLMDRFDRWDRTRRDHGFAPIREAWLAHGPRLGEPVLIRRHGLAHGGDFAGLGPDGALLLRTNTGVRGFTTGEIEDRAPCCC